MELARFFAVPLSLQFRSASVVRVRGKKQTTTLKYKKQETTREQENDDNTEVVGFDCSDRESAAKPLSLSRTKNVSVAGWHASLDIFFPLNRALQSRLKKKEKNA